MSQATLTLELGACKVTASLVVTQPQGLLYTVHIDVGHSEHPAIVR